MVVATGVVLTGAVFAGGVVLTAVVVTAAYMLWMMQRVLLGEFNPKWEGLPDANQREIISLTPLAALTLFFGILPAPLLAIFNTASQAIVALGFKLGQ